MPVIPAAYRGPLVIVGLGVGFAAVGSVPVAITFSLGTRSSATIIGMGFVGFGFLLMLPGMFWCVMVRSHSFKSWRRRLRRGRTADDEQGTDDDGEQTPALQMSRQEANGPSDTVAVARSKCWPPSYRDPPPVIVTDCGICRASTPVDHCTAADDDDPDRPVRGVVDPGNEAGLGDQICCHSTTITVTDVDGNSDVGDDSLRLLPTLEHQVGTFSSVPSTDGTVPACDG